MKRYTLYSGFFDQRKKANNSAASPIGEWVPAEVAQALYDALHQITESFQGQQHLRGDHYSEALDALSLADGESE